MPLVTIEIPNPVLPAGWVFKVRYAQQVFGMPLVWNTIADQTNAPFNLILAAAGYVLEVTLDMDGTLCEPVYNCFRVHPPCAGCPSAVNISIYQGQNIKYLQVDMQFSGGFPYCGLKIHAFKNQLLTVFNQTVIIPTLSSLTPVVIGGVTWYRQVFVLSGLLNLFTFTYFVEIEATCCSYETHCYDDSIEG